ncbi:MAG: AMP-binding protein, partial [bacterium]|nr:AMP-binding protein [bacterium]
TMPMRNYPDAGKTFNAYLKEVKENPLSAFENQEYQFEDLVENISIKRDAGRNPLFDVMLNLLNQSGNTSMHTDSHQGDILVGVTGNEETLSGDEYINTTSKFDLNLTGYEDGQNINFQIEYCTALFSLETIERFITYFKTTLREVVENPGKKISDVAIITEDEKRQVLFEFNGAHSEYPGDKTIHELFEEQAARSPDSISILGIKKKNGKRGQITYKKLNEEAGSRAEQLREKGVGPGTVVAIMVERSIRMITGIISILKAGAAYLPIDPAYPDDRIKYILEDSNARVVLTETPAVDRLAKLSEKIGIVDINGITRHEPTIETRHPASRPHPASRLVYVIYTSGSTGKPKGVLLEHRNLVNLVHYQFIATTIDFSRVLQFTTIGFDVAAQEIFSTLLSGGRMTLIARETLNDIPALFDLVRRDRIKTLFFPASFLMFTMNDDAFVRQIPPHVRHIVTAGEQVVVNDTFREYLKRENVRLHNHYGPSETHVVTTLTLEPGEEIPVLPGIGKPIANTKIYIMDKGQNLLPQNIAGELYIGGAAVGRGYLNNPELTAEKFVNYKLQATNYKQITKNKIQTTNKKQKTKKENEPEKGKQSQLPGTALQIKAFGGVGTS